MNTNSDSPSLLIIGAHPDDAEYHAGGLATIYRALGRRVKMLSVTDGGAGHFRRTTDELVPLRRQESAAAGEVIGAIYETLDFPDGQLVPSIEVRQRIIQEIREFQPDLVLTHRLCDYHPDHRATGQVVQDASYLITVPLVLPEVAPLFAPPVFAFMADLFTRPTRLRADVVIDIEQSLDSVVSMLACQRSQVYEWLPYSEGILEAVPDNEGERKEWLRDWYIQHVTPRADHFRAEIIAAFGEARGEKIQLAEAFEISEYGASASSERLRELFPEGELTDC
ncbi:MAG: PIG-L family deacetylase [Pirellulales bacterium]